MVQAVEAVAADSNEVHAAAGDIAPDIGKSVTAELINVISAAGIADDELEVAAEADIVPVNEGSTLSVDNAAVNDNADIGKPMLLEIVSVGERVILETEGVDADNEVAAEEVDVSIGLE